MYAAYVEKSCCSQIGHVPVCYEAKSVTSPMDSPFNRVFQVTRGVEQLSSLQVAFLPYVPAVFAYGS